MQRTAPTCCALVATALLAIADSTAGQDFRAYLDESPRDRERVERVRRLSAAGNHQEAATAIAEAFDVSLDTTDIDTHRGLWLDLRRAIYGLPEAGRRAYRQAVADMLEAEAPASPAEPGVRELQRLANRFPCTEVGRSAARRLWAMDFESGKLARALSRLEDYLADPDLTKDDRHAALFAKGVCATSLGLAVEARRIARRLDDELAPETARRFAMAGHPAERLRTLIEQQQATEVSRSWHGTAAEALRRSGGDYTFPTRILIDAADGATGNGGAEAMSRRELLTTAHQEPGGGTNYGLLATRRRLIVGRGRHVTAYDRAGGERMWRLRWLPPGVTPVPLPQPSCDERTLAMVTFEQTDVGRNRATHNAVWQSLHGLSRRLVAVDPESGRRLWSWPQAPEDQPAPNASPPAPQADPGTALRPAGSPLVHEGRVYMVAVRRPPGDFPVESFLMCLDAGSGELLWKRFLGGGVLMMFPPGSSSLDHPMPCTDGRRIYVASGVGSIAAIDLSTTAIAWVHTFPRPRPRRRDNIFTGTWPAYIRPGIVSAKGRLVVTDAGTRRIDCIDAATSRVQWTAEVGPAVVVNLRSGGLIVAMPDDYRIAELSLDDGAELWTLNVPWAVQGPGLPRLQSPVFPTQAGLARLRLDGATPTAELLELPWSADLRAAVPVGPDVVLGVGTGSVALYGRAEALETEVRRSGAFGRPGALNCIWLAALAGQRGRFDEAIALLDEAEHRIANRKASPETRRIVDRLAHARVALHLAIASERAEADSLPQAEAHLGRAARYVRSDADRLRVQLGRARLQEHAGESGKAAEQYARLAGDSAAAILPTDGTETGLYRPVATEAELRLMALRPNADDRMPAGLLPEAAADVAAYHVASRAWAGPSRVLTDIENAFSPTVWVRPDCLVAFGPKGRIRWRRRWSTGARPALDQVALTPGSVLVGTAVGVSAFDRHGGDILWTWQPPQGAALPAGTPDDEWARHDQLRRAEAVSGRTFLFSREVFEGDANTICVAGDVAAVRLSREGREAPDSIAAIDLRSGETVWTLDVPADTLNVAMRPLGDGLLATFRSSLELAFHRIDPRTGDTRWTVATVVPIDRWCRGLATDELIVTNDAGGDVLAIAADSGRVILHRRVSDEEVIGAVPIAASGRHAVFQSDRGFAAMDLRTARVTWRRDTTGDAGPPPCVVAGRHVLIAGSQAILAIDIATGERRWRQAVEPGASGRRTAVMCGGILVEGSVKGSRATLRSPETGRKLAAVTPAEGKGYLHLRPFAGGLYVRCGEQMYVVSPESSAGEHRNGMGQ